jgi:hypothetical protein
MHMFHWLSKPAGKPPHRGRALTAGGTYGEINLLSFHGTTNNNFSLSTQNLEEIILKGLWFF